MLLENNKIFQQHSHCSWKCDQSRVQLPPSSNKYMSASISSWWWSMQLWNKMWKKYLTSLLWVLNPTDTRQYWWLLKIWSFSIYVRVLQSDEDSRKWGLWVSTCKLIGDLTVHSIDLPSKWMTLHQNFERLFLFIGQQNMTKVHFSVWPDFGHKYF